MRVLVTGHNGYIGTILTPMLQECGYDVVGLDSDLYEKCTFTGKIPDVHNIRKDIRDIQKHEVEGFDAIIHLAGLSNDPLGNYRPELTEEINEKASVRLAYIAKEAAVRRFLFASSCSYYGSTGDNFLNESAPFNPVTPYGVSKVRVEHALSKMKDSEFSPTYLRAATAYGVSPRLRFDLVTNNLTAWAFTTGQVYLKSDGTSWRPIVHIEDIARAYIAVLNAPRELIHDEAFNVGTTCENYQIKDIAAMVQAVVPNCEIKYAPDAGPDKRCYRVDCNKIARTLHDFKPQWTARRGIEQLYKEYKNVGLTLEEFEGSKFNRVDHLKHLISGKILSENLRWTVHKKNLRSNDW